MDNCELKPALSFEQQLDRLENFHHLTIGNKKVALRILKTVNYYRLTAYGIGLTKKDNKEEYRDGVTLKTLYDLYIFDSKLRNLILPEIESVEIYLRTHISYILGRTYGPIGYLCSDNFIDRPIKKLDTTVHSYTMHKLDIEIDRQKDAPFVKHHIKNYGGKFPIWVASELFSFGALSSLYWIMKPNEQKYVSDLFNVEPSRLYSWMLALLEIRNKCAHYCRLYNMPLTKAPSLFSEDSNYLDSSVGPRLFLSIIALKKIMKFFKKDWNVFLDKLKSLLQKYKDVVNLSYIGFPKNWFEILSN